MKKRNVKINIEYDEDRIENTGVETSKKQIVGSHIIYRNKNITVRRHLKHLLFGRICQ